MESSANQAMSSQALVGRRGIMRSAGKKIRAIVSAVTKRFEPHGSVREAKKALENRFPFVQVSLVETDTSFIASKHEWNRRLTLRKKKRRHTRVRALLDTGGNLNVISHELAVSTNQFIMCNKHQDIHVDAQEPFMLDCTGTCFIDVEMPGGRLFRRQRFHVVKNLDFSLHISNEFFGNMSSVRFSWLGATRVLRTTQLVDVDGVVWRGPELCSAADAEDASNGCPCVDVMVGERLIPTVIVNTCAITSIMDHHFAYTELKVE